MRKTLLIFSLALIISCSKADKDNRSTDSFVYSFSAQHLDYSIKFNDNDTVYFQKRFPEPVSNYYAVIKNNEKRNIIEIIDKINFSRYDSIYEQQNLKDGDGFKFYKTKKSKVNSIYVYGNKAPEELYHYTIQFNNLSKTFNFKPFDGKVDFGNLSHILLLTPPPVSYKDSLGN